MPLPLSSLLLQSALSGSKKVWLVCVLVRAFSQRDITSIFNNWISGSKIRVMTSVHMGLTALVLAALLAPLQAVARTQVAIINLVPFHHEVYPAFTHAWERAGYEVSAFVNGGADFGMADVTTGWGFKFENLTSFPHNFCKFNVVIFTSVEYGRDFHMASRIVQSGCRHQQRYIFVVHNPRALRDSRRGPSKLLALVTGQPNIHVVGLSPHTTAAMTQIFKDNGHDQSVDYMIPLFPIDSLPVRPTHSGFVLQGSISDKRRNYKKLIEGVVGSPASWAPGFKLVVLGKGNVSIPEEARSLVRLQPNSPYPEYYDTIQKSYGLLTAFASKIYFREKASSTVAASLICGTPLLTEPETLKVYSYLSESSVWLRKRRESDVEAMHRILSEADLEEEFAKRVASLGKDIEQAHIYNTVTVDKIMSALLSSTIASDGK